MESVADFTFIGCRILFTLAIQSTIPCYFDMAFRVVTAELAMWRTALDVAIQYRCILSGWAILMISRFFRDWNWLPTARWSQYTIIIKILSKVSNYMIKFCQYAKNETRRIQIPVIVPSPWFSKSSIMYYSVALEQFSLNNLNCFPFFFHNFFILYFIWHGSTKPHSFLFQYISAHTALRRAIYINTNAGGSLVRFGCIPRGSGVLVFRNGMEGLT